MTRRNIGAIILGIATFIAIGYTIMKYVQGGEIGFNEISVIAILVMIFLSSVTWGKSQEDGITPEEELGQKITDKSSKISYYALTLFILVIIGAEQIITGTTNVSMLIILGLAMVTLPFVEFLVARKYQ